MTTTRPAVTITPSAPRASENPVSPLDPVSPWPPRPNAPGLPAPGPKTGTNSTEELPSAKEIYGLIAVLGTYLLFAVYLIWAICPPAWLDRVGWTWYPSRDWAIVVPSYLMLVVWLAYLGYAALGAFLTPSFDSPSLITDGYSSITAPSNGDLYYWKFTDPEVIPEAIDLPIDLVNRVLYPPRPRPRPRPKPRRRRSGSSA